MAGMTIASPEDFRHAACRRLPPFLRDYVEGGAFDELTLERNRTDLQALALRQRVLRGSDQVDLATKVLGRDQAMPIILGPVGLTGMYRRRGEVQAARAAAASKIPYCLPTLSICPIAEVAAAAPLKWFQLYVLKDRGFMADMLARIREADVEVLVLTVDLPLPGIRYRDAHSGLSGHNAAFKRTVQSLLHPQWGLDVGLLGRPHDLGNLSAYLGQPQTLDDYIGWLAKNFDPGIGWELVDELRAAWPGKLVIKGILEASDAREALARGADGIIVSNHGGRQLDGALSTARALPRIVDAVGNDLDILVDGGVRNGLDVLKMLALGAKSVLIGRAYIYALASQGQSGIERLLAMMAHEMRVAMTLTGVASMAEIGPHLIDDGR